MKSTYRIVVIFFIVVFLGFRPKAQTVGVLNYTDEVTPGLVLFAPVSSGEVYLVNECGEMVNNWSYDGKPGLMGRLNDDGSLIITKRIISSVFNGGGIGGGLLSYSWDGTLLWDLDLTSTTFNPHHDVAILPNGNVLINGWDLITPEEAAAHGRVNTSMRGLWSEKLIELQIDSNGEYVIVWEWRAWDHIIQDQDESLEDFGIIADHPERLDVNFTNGSSNMIEDWLHVNSIDYNEDLDQILINCRDLNEFWVIDHSTTTEEAANSEGGNYGKGGDFLYRWGNPQSYKGGNESNKQLFKQHDASWINNSFPMGGSIAVFNNGVGRPDGSYSTIDVIKPVIVDGEYQFDGSQYAPLKSTVLYGQPDGFDEFFYSSRISGSQSFSNGNTLICIGQDSRFIEINSDREIVWDYVNPAGNTITEQGDQVGNANNVFQTTKYSYDFIGFENKDLTPGPKIEINPIDNCSLTVSISNDDLLQVAVINSIVTDQLFISNHSREKCQVNIYTLAGSLVHSSIYQSEREISIPFHDFHSGVYAIQILIEGKGSNTSKIVKPYE